MKLKRSNPTAICRGPPVKTAGPQCRPAPAETGDPSYFAGVFFSLIGVPFFGPLRVRALVFVR